MKSLVSALCFALAAGPAFADHVQLGTPVQGVGAIEVPIFALADVPLAGWELTVEYVAAGWTSVEVVKGAALNARPSSVLTFDAAYGSVSGALQRTDTSLKVNASIVDLAECLPAGTVGEVARIRFVSAVRVPVWSGFIGWNTAVNSGDPETSEITCEGNEIILAPEQCFPNPPDTINARRVAREARVCRHCATGKPEAVDATWGNVKALYATP